MNMAAFTTITGSPKTFIGWNSSERIGSILQSIAPKKTLLIADPRLVELGLHKAITGRLDARGYRYYLYDKVTPEPSLGLGQEIVDLARGDDFSFVIGFGGGSALDLAKIASVFVSNPGSLVDYLGMNKTRSINSKGIPKMLIPTTSGTGTEVTNISVLSLDKNKDAIVHDYLIADIAVVDPQFTLSLPKKVTATTGADALTHAIEAYISVNRNPYSDGLALQALRLIGQSLVKATKKGDDKIAREGLSYGSYLAGLAFFNAGVGAVHALAYPLGGRFHLAHGESNAVLLPYVMNHIKSVCGKDMEEMVRVLDKEVESPTSAGFIRYLFNLLQEIGIAGTLKGYNISASDLQLLTADGILQKRLLARCPKDLTESDIFEIYRSAYYGNMD